MTRVNDVVLLAASRVGGEVVPARAQMATTLGFHIILACLGIALPAVVAAELTAVGTPSCVAASAHCRDSMAARSDNSTQAALGHDTKFPIW